MLSLEQAYKNQEELEKNINLLKEEIANIESDPESHIDSVDFEAMYDEMLDEVHGEFMGYPASKILEDVDPVAYRVGYSNYVGGYDVKDTDEYKEKQEELEDLETELEELEEEIDELENEEE
jgi:peptidoglycan hydrolase CwlO-like protein